MITYASIENGKVIGIYAFASTEVIGPDKGTFVDVTSQPEVQVGWIYLSGDSFEAPPEIDIIYNPVITTVDFVELFTPAEFMAVEALIGIDPITTQLYKVAELQGQVDMSSPKVTEIALPNFVTLGVLTQERADEISNSWQNDEEP